MSCSYFFKEKEEHEDTYDLSISEKAGVACVKNNSDLLKDYFEMRRDDVQIAQDLMAMKTCLNDAIKLFLNHTKGSNGDVYNAQELHRFLTKAFDSYDYPIGFMEDAIRLKESLIGGDLQTITKEELTKLPLYIDYAYDTLASHAPERRLLFKKDITTTRDNFPQASQRFLKSVAGIKNLPRKTQGDFDYASFARMINYLLDEDDKEVRDALVLINSLQALIASGSKDKINVEKLPFVVENLAQLYLGYIEYHKFLENDFFDNLGTVFIFPGMLTESVELPTVFSGEVPDIIASIHNNLLTPLIRAIEAAPAQKLSINYLYDFVDSVEQIKAFPQEIKASALKLLAPKLLGLWLSENPCTQNCEAELVKIENVNRILKTGKDWKERQVWINSMKDKFGDKLNAQQFKDKAQQKSITSNLGSFQESYKSVSHAHWEKYVVIGSKEFVYKDAVIFNQIYTLLHLFARPYNGNDKLNKIVDYYMTRGQAQEFYDWFRPLAIDLKFADPRSRHSGKDAFIEMNLFTSMSANHEQASFSEIMEYLQIAISTSHRSVDLMEDVQGAPFAGCKIANSPDVFQFNKIQAPCFRQIFNQQYANLFVSTLGGLKNYLGAVPEAVPVYLKYLEMAGRQGLIVDHPVETDAFRYISSISQYGESFFLRFDSNADGVITDGELKKVLLHVGPNLRILIRESGISQSKAEILFKAFANFEGTVVSYIAKYHEIPEIILVDLNSISALAKATKQLKEWEKLEMPWVETEAQVKREDIVLVIGALSAFARANRIKNIKEIFTEKELEFNGVITDPNEEAFVKLSAELKCSTLLETQVRAWLLNNQKSYWQEALQLFQTNPPADPPPLLADWQGAVTMRLVQGLNAEPTLGPLCLLPYLEAD